MTEEDNAVIIEHSQEGGAEEVVLVRSPHYQTIYSNSARIIKTPWDFTISFAALTEQEPSPNTVLTDKVNMVTEQRVSVVMSPEHAKVLARIFIDQVQKWEERFGQIPTFKPALVKLNIELGEESVSPETSPSTSPGK